MDDEIRALDDLLTRTKETSPLVKILVPGSLWHEVRVDEYVLTRSLEMKKDPYPHLDVTIMDYFSAGVLEIARIGIYLGLLHPLINY